jgi:hypothetical protein
MNHKRYIVKQGNGSVLRGQRGYSSQDVAPKLYKTVAGAERAAAKVNGGVFTIYITTNSETLVHENGFYDDQIKNEITRLGISPR